MQILCLIFFLLTVALWFLSNEYPAVFGIYVPACSLRRIYFKSIVAICILLSVYFSLRAGVPQSISDLFFSAPVNCQSVLKILVSSVITLMLLHMLSLTGPAIYAICGALGAYSLCSGMQTSGRMLVSVVAALLCAFVLSAVIRTLFRVTLEKCSLHLITLSHYMRLAALAGLVLTTCAVGLNWGGFLMAGIKMNGLPDSAVWAVMAVLALMILFLSPFMREESDCSAGKYADFSIYAVITVGFSVAFTLIIFSFSASAGIMGLIPVPLSVSSLVLASIAGVEVAQRNRLVENEDYIKEGMGQILAPLGSFVIAYVIFRVSGENEVIVDVTIISIAVLIVALLFFAAYIRSHIRQRRATERLVYSQQQQIYEHSRALNDMELKVVLSENQALHNAVEMKRQEVVNVALSIVEQREYLESLNEIAKKLSKTSDEGERNGLISELRASLKQRLSYDRDVDSQYFYAQAESLHEDFNAKLSENFPDLTQQERRLATLLRLGFSSKYIATLMNITPKSVEISRYRLRQKLGLSRGDNLVNFIKSI